MANKYEEYLYSFILCVWDNVIGPKVVKTWPSSTFYSQDWKHDIDEIGVEVTEEMNDKHESISCEGNSPQQVTFDEISKYIAVHTLTGHLVKNGSKDYEQMTEVCLSVPALNFISQTVTFYSLLLHHDELCQSEEVVELDDPCMSSLTIVFHYTHQNMFWKINFLLIHLLHKIAERIRVGISQDSNYYNHSVVHKWWSEAYEEIIISANLYVSPPLSKLISVKSTYYELPISWNVIITAVLTTSGSCCVVGTSVELINKVIDLLVLFIPETQKLLCSRYASQRFCSGLLIQGLVENTQGSRNINAADVLLNEYPLTVIDLTRKCQVKFSGFIHEHTINKYRQLKQQEYNLHQSLDPNIPFTTQSVVRPFTGYSRYVQWCLEQLETHNVEHWTRIIASFHRALCLQAVHFMELFKHELHQSSKGTKNMGSIRSRIKHSMQIRDPDFWLLLAVAEGFQPGFSQCFIYS